MVAAGGKGSEFRAGAGRCGGVRSVFHSQQAAEKAVKAILTFRQIAFRRTHDLMHLGAQCAAADPTLEPILRKVEELTDYASAFRYPDAPYEPDSAEAMEALAVAGRLFDEVRGRIGDTAPVDGAAEF